MATLKQTLRGLPQADDQISRGPGGVLQRGPTLQEATKAAGLAAAPTTPLAAQMTGASTQAAKMAGTPQQMQAALQQATQAPTLGTALRQKQYGREVTAAEAGAMSKSADMQKLGGLGDRVTKMVQNEYDKLSAVTAKPAAATEYAGKDITQIAGDLEIVRTNPTSQEAKEAMVRINTFLGKTDPNAVLEATEFNKLYQDAQTAIGGAAAIAIRDVRDIPISEVVGDLGYDLPALAGLLNVPEQDLQKYTVKQLQDKVDQVSREEFSRAQQLQQQATSPLVGAAERGLAREAGRELSVTGVRASEADMQRLASEIDSADQVSLMGQTKSYADWLADDEISAMVKEVLDSPANSQLRKDLKEQAPDFYNFVTRNETALKAASANIETGATQFKQIQESNKKAIEDLGIDMDTATKIAPDIAGIQSKLIDMNAVPVFKFIASTPAESRPIVSDEIKSAITNNLVSAEELNTLTEPELNQLRIGQADSSWARWKTKEQERKAFARAASPEKQLEFIVSGGLTIPQINDIISGSKKLSEMGIPTSLNLGALDVNGDGQPDWDKLDQAYSKLNPPISLKQAVGGVTPTVRQTLQPPRVTSDILNSIPLNLEKVRQLDQLRGTPGISIDPIITAMREGQEKTPELIQAQVFGPATRQYRGQPIPIDYSDRLVQLSKQGNFVDKDALRNSASSWILDLAAKNPAGLFYSHGLNLYNNLQAAGLLTPEAVSVFRAKVLPKGYDPEGKGNPLKWYSDSKGTGYR